MRGKTPVPGRPAGPASFPRALRQGKPKLRVLVAEPDPLVALDFRAMIEGYGGEVVGIARSGEEAVSLAVRLRPDVVVFDVRLEGEIDGIAAALDIQAEQDQPVIFVTGEADVTGQARLRQATDQPPLLKPVSPARLHAALVRACALLPEG